MQISRIIPGQWYQTKHGAGLCVKVLAGGRILMTITNEKGVKAARYLKPAEVQHEIAKGQEPQINPQAPNKERPWDDVWRHCQHCQGRTKHVPGEAPPEFCYHCGKSLLIPVERSTPAKYSTVIVDEGGCIEVFMGGGALDGALLGYAIRFGGSWDAWQVQHPGHQVMRRVAVGLPTPEEAVAAIVK